MRSLCDFHVKNKVKKIEKDITDMENIEEFDLMYTKCKGEQQHLVKEVKCFSITLRNKKWIWKKNQKLGSSEALQV